ncbi:MAG TPA: carbohydrate-binding family 9-like protein, partial [Flavitalea sp.]|nr:carbohydrate-binding family 9-like protein [Flavitalea sp.]
MNLSQLYRLHALLLILFCGISCTAQTSNTDSAREYLVRRVLKNLAIDGKLDQAWDAASWSPPFVDIEGSRKSAPSLTTRIRMLYDDQFLYVFAEMEEPDLSASLTARDAIIFRDNDFEVFLDPNNDQQEYFEYEINALGTVMDLFMPMPYKKGGKADLSWDSPGLQSAVFLDGTLNKNSDTDKGWTVELAIPFKDMERPGRVNK